MDFPRSPHFAAAPLPPSVQNSNSSAPGRDISSNLTSGTDPQAQSQSQPPQSPRPLSHSQHTPTTPAPTFRAPAHRHAHHLHSIPPREKSTRTLIIDQLLWVHARTRLAQARAELAMTDRTGGPRAPNYAHRERPEEWDETEEVPSEGEQDDVDDHALRARSRGSDYVDGGDEEEGLGMSARQDLPFARRLRQRAESLENVVTSMLEQPPRDIPLPEDEPFTPNHVLPNGVRLRLALATIINYMFARPAPVHRHSHFQGAVPAASSSASGSDSDASSPRRPTQASLPSSTPSPAPLPRLLPQSLVPLLSVSSIGTTQLVAVLRWRLGAATHFHSDPPHRQQPFAIDPPSPRVHDMFTASGTHPSTASPTSLPRCPRHLNYSCEICIVPGRGAYINIRPRGETHTDSSALVAQGGGISGFAEGAGIGSGLARSRTGGTLLRRPETVSSRPPPQDDETYPSLSDDPEVRAQGAGNTILAGLIPRFVRLSALFALELGREVSAEEIGPSSGSGSGPDNNRDRVAGAGVALVPTVQWYSLLASLLTHAVLEGYLTAEWRGLAPLQVLLGLGLGDAAIPHDANDEDSAVPRSPAVMVEDKYVEFEPDGMPDLSDAVDVLFPGRRANASVGGRRTGNASDGGGEEERGENSDRVGGRMNDNAARRGGGEAEYAREMGQRLARFLDVPAGTRDLATHLEALTRRYPVEPVERAALRFCEALTQWRGKPELETYKEYSPMPSHRVSVPLPTMTAPAPQGVLEGGGIANAAVRRAIGRYFVIPPGMTTATAASAPDDVLESDEDARAGGRVVTGRKRAHSAMSGEATASNGSTSGGDRWRERRGYI
ncbi:hypothetical protein DFH94DRAFT_699894 [Russula ochroleuca]|uniref:Uncharacterized protein n=1 Tax=Russula ochroleuca TaxID=152965 RepID=A0A9P5JU18_9AGAM|nr:hypothetical protein DFH94DRAFT_699894 [Russula ochroleuca]